MALTKEEINQMWHDWFAVDPFVTIKNRACTNYLITNGQLLQ